MAKWQGTVVPNSGYVEKVYLNTNLSVDEVVSLLSQLETNENDAGFILVSEDSSKIIGFMYLEGTYAILNATTDEFYFISNDLGWGFVGWNTAISYPLIINNNVVNSFQMEGNNFVSGTQNNLLTSLFSITPFTQSQPTTADKLQKLIDGKQYVIDKTNAKAGTSLNIKSKWKDIGDVIEGIESGGNALIKGDWKGTVVPNSGYVDKVYLNTNLSVDEVVAICKTLTFVPYPDGSYDIWACLTDETMANGIAIMRLAGIYYAIVHTIDGESNFLFSNLEEDDITIGWQEGVTGVVEFNIENQLSVVAPALNFTPENEKAAQLFSTTPFVQSILTLEGVYDGSTLTITEPNAIDIKSLIENDKRIPLQIKLDLDQPNKVYADGVEVYGYDENGNKYLVIYEEVA